MAKQRAAAMRSCGGDVAKFIIAPHMRLHEWIARDKGYFDREGLDYEFRDQLVAPTAIFPEGEPGAGRYEEAALSLRG
jgi:hypothetical protein